MRKGFKNLSLREKDSELLTDLAKLTKKSKAQFLHELIVSMEEFIGRFPNGCSLQFEICSLDKTILITAIPNLSVKLGKFDMGEYLVKEKKRREK
jgi:hypothetical protein